jgi:hypothetical protein
MKSTPMRRQKPLRQRRREGADVETDGPKPWAAALSASTVRPLRAASYTGGTAPAPKTSAYRDPALLEMARDRPCLLLVPGICNHRVDTTVAAHSNQSCHGKAGARKADDLFSCWSCAACHSWLDSSRADAFLKIRAFTEAHVRQIMAWKQIAADASEPARFRRAAARAVEALRDPA